jgi:predicted RNA-binding Zn-ribbon protein involved in translation (DUF1610 family)
MAHALPKPEPKCPTCQEAMQQGFVVDFSFPDRSTRVANWVEGPPQKRFWSGLDLEDKKQREVVAFRCPRCGLLQNYAL